MHALRGPRTGTLSRPTTRARAASASSTTTALALTNPPLASSSPSTNAAAAAAALALAVAPLDRGALATPRDAARVEGLARDLERLAPAARRPPSALAGRWRLLYISTPALFRQSPFFDAFAAAVGDAAAAEAIFRFTNELPMARVGSAWQKIELEGGGEGIGGGNEGGRRTGRLVSSVELAVGELPFFPGFAGVVESSASIDGVTCEPDDSYRVTMTVTQTRVTDSLFSALGGDAVVAPVERAFEAVRGPGAARIAWLVTALGGAGGGATLRVTRAEGTGLLMVHALEEAE